MQIRLQSFRDWLACREEVTGSAVAVGTTGGQSSATTTADIANVKGVWGPGPRRDRKSPKKILFNFGKQKG